MYPVLSFRKPSANASHPCVQPKCDESRHSGPLHPPHLCEKKVINSTLIVAHTKNVMICGLSYPNHFEKSNGFGKSRYVSFSQDPIGPRRLKGATINYDVEKSRPVVPFQISTAQSALLRSGIPRT